ncbi:trehalose-phosphatase [Mycolicibacterium sp. 050158]|uniref:trehalose-phosphatase n=1 Tax=Mycolicibacterium sp. 050158 TaxID=3090602 RepID=UPI00299EC1C8|nr:trehalose-phosphatase [Mycolicibacterium sp. 050158]MDX1890783.1 trehalose-phosphatase [Mycolicibacterium sp. 050158]
MPRAGAVRAPVIDGRRYDATLFDLDGVVTDTASLHARAWTRVFDDFLRERGPRSGEDHSPFTDSDYRRHVDGRSRLDGIREFLAARGIPTVESSVGETSGATVVSELAERKQQLYEQLMTAGVDVFDSTVALVRRLRGAGLRTAVYSASMNCEAVLRIGGVTNLFDVRVDGRVAAELGLPGKPDPALLLETATRIGARPDRCVVVEDASPGIVAGRTGGFGLVIGVGPEEHLDELLADGADAAVTDLTAVTVRTANRRMSSLPGALASVEMLGALLSSRRPAVFVDFDGTLSDIVTDPAAATIRPDTRAALAELSLLCPVGVLSGRDVLDVRDRIGLPDLWYAGNHGLDLLAPDGVRHDHEEALAADPALERAAESLRDLLAGVDGIELERKRHAIAVHDRRVDPTAINHVTAVVHEVGLHEGLRVTHGRKVIELQADLDWDKGTALRWISSQLGVTDPLPVYVGDDLTDEDAFDAVEHDGIGILVCHGEDGDRLTAARFAVSDPKEAAALLTQLGTHLRAQRRDSSDLWRMTFDGYDTATEGVREVLCGIGNGLVGVRGSTPEARAGAVHYPGTYRLGVYDRLSDDVAGASVSNESMVNLPNWLPFTFAIGDDPWFDLDAGTHDLLSYRQCVDVRRAELTREFRVRDGRGRITALSQHRFVSMRDPHLCGMRTTLRAENWSGTMRFRSAIDGGVVNGGVRRYQDLSGRHLEPPVFADVGGNGVLCVVRTTQSHVRIAVAARTVVLGDEPAPARYRSFAKGAEVGHLVSTDVAAGHSVHVEKMAVIYTGRDDAISEPAEAAREHLERVGGYGTHVAEHITSWSHLWERFHLHVDDSADLRLLRLHVYHLLQSASPHTADADVGIPARGVHGEAYRGHVFWDDLFVMPVLNLHLPDVTRSFLRYRHRRLAEACHAARMAGFSGAMFPWQSGSSGREESQSLHLNPRSGRWNPDPSALAHHVGAAVAYTVWQYYQVTADLEFLTRVGAEMLVQIARFWVSTTRFDDTRGRYVIDGVIGPDEFHTGYPGQPHRGVDNNAYTNVMAVWCILRARDALDALPLPDRLDLTETLHLDGVELVLWDRVTRLMFVPFHDGVISQFEGYADLAELDLARYRERYGDIGRMDRILEAEGADVNAHQVAKQADVVMLFHLFSADEVRELLARLGYRFDPGQVPRTIDYYLARTTHGSTLSAVVFSWVLARGNRSEGTEYFHRVLASDQVDPRNGTTAEGIHLAAMAGSIDLLQRCYAGLETRHDRLILGPMWPEDAGTLRFSLQYRGHRLHLRITGRSARVIAEPSGAAPVVVECRGRTTTLHAGAEITVS